MTDRDPTRPVTVINRFEVTGGLADFEREFSAHSQFLRRRPGFDFLVTVRLVERPHVYVHLAHWQRLSGWLDTVHDDTFTGHVHRVGRLVRTEADQALSVDRVLSEDAAPGDSSVVLLSAEVREDHAQFEKAYAELCRIHAEGRGFGGSDLLRSTVRPSRYTGVLWWRDEEHCDRALGSAEGRRALAALDGPAQVRCERSRHLAYERVVPARNV
ncbi:antibiotic biosynthesis monooxygenase family protein [Streptomyces sp. NPDC127049]|uniref:antibiotic biosynthesis monooxygenase family protein n=1 Tax=Streptomyces sp. NPDC127049 TaxID=3347118 RepID=UPI003646D54A